MSKQAAPSAPRIDADFPGGNIVVDDASSDPIRLRPDLRDTEGWWFHWHFRVCGAQGRALAFDLGENRAISSRGPAISLDAGRTWRWLGTDSFRDNTFRYEFGADEKSVHFAVAIPYQVADLGLFIERCDTHPAFGREVLGIDRDGSRPEMLRVGPPPADVSHRILLACRHHCCECAASYVLEGLIDAALADDETGKWFQNRVEILAVPMVDMAGVEAGDQGKNRRPHDHNRDYGNARDLHVPGAHGSVHPMTRAIRGLTDRLSAGPGLDAALDLHCPWLYERPSSDPNAPVDPNERIYMVQSQHPAVRAEQQDFSVILERVASALPYRTSDMLLFGQRWNTSERLEETRDNRNFTTWASEDAHARLACTFEIPYANALGAEINPTSCRGFGRDIARALPAYLSERA